MPYWDKQRNAWRAKIMRSGVTKTQFCPTRKAARDWEMEQKELPLDEFLNGISLTSSLAEWAEKYLADVQQRFSQQTLQEKQVAFREFFKSVNPKLEPAMLRPAIALAHFNKQAQARSGHAANKDRKNLVAAWNWAIAYLPKWPKDNPFAEVKRQREEESPRYVPPIEDFWKVYDQIQTGQDKVLLFTLLHTAARKGELFKMLWDDLDFHGRKVRLWTRKRQGGLEQDWIPMTQELFDMLSWWFRNRTFPDHKHVFVCEEKNNYCSDFYGQPFLYRRHWMARICEKAGVRPFGFHAIRHLSAISLDDAGYPLAVIQAILRHRSANTTALYLKRLKGIRIALDDAFRRKDPPPTPQKFGGRPALRVIQGGRLVAV